MTESIVQLLITICIVTPTTVILMTAIVLRHLANRMDMRDANRRRTEEIQSDNDKSQRDAVLQAIVPLGHDLVKMLTNAKGFE